VNRGCYLVYYTHCNIKVGIQLTLQCMSQFDGPLGSIGGDPFPARRQGEADIGAPSTHGLNPGVQFGISSGQYSQRSAPVEPYEAPLAYGASKSRQEGSSTWTTHEDNACTWQTSQCEQISA
jgi:hypothetical protein